MGAKIINNSAVDCPISLKFNTHYDHVTPDVPQSCKDKGNFFSLDAFVLSQYTRLTDGQTDRRTDGFTIPNTALHTMQRRKKQIALLSQINCAAGWVSFGWVVGDDVGQTILCTKRCRCQKTKSIDLLTNPLLYEKRSLCVFELLFGGNVCCSS